MEGPFVNKEKKGAQKEEDIKLADVELFHKLQGSSRWIDQISGSCARDWKGLWILSIK